MTGTKGMKWGKRSGMKRVARMRNKATAERKAGKRGMVVKRKGKGLFDPTFYDVYKKR